MGLTGKTVYITATIVELVYIILITGLVYIIWITRSICVIPAISEVYIIRWLIPAAKQA